MITISKNFLDEETINTANEICFSNFPIIFKNNLIHNDDFYFYHNIYSDNIIFSEHFDIYYKIVEEFCEKNNMFLRSLINAKIILDFNEFEKKSDQITFKSSNKTLIYFINSCNAHINILNNRDGKNKINNIIGEAVLLEEESYSFSLINNSPIRLIFIAEFV